MAVCGGGSGSSEWRAYYYNTYSSAAVSVDIMGMGWMHTQVGSRVTGYHRKSGGVALKKLVSSGGAARRVVLRIQPYSEVLFTVLPYLL